MSITTIPSSLAQRPTSSSVATLEPQPASPVPGTALPTQPTGTAIVPAPLPITDSSFRNLTPGAAGGAPAVVETAGPAKNPDLARAAAANGGTVPAVTGTATFAALSQAQQAQVLEVAAKLDPQGQQQLAALANRTLQAGQPPVAVPALLDRDSQGNTLLDSLQKIASGPLEPGFLASGVTRYSLLGSILQETANPGEINQGNRGTCTVTSMQYMLCSRNPAEYVRLMAGLLSPEGTAPLRNGDKLVRTPDSIAPDNDTTRSPSERVFQSAMMDYCNGEKEYKNLDDARTSGLTTDGEQERGLEALFGGKFIAFPVRHQTPEDEAQLQSAWHSLTPEQRVEWIHKSKDAPPFTLPEEWYAQEDLKQRLSQLPPGGALAAISYGSIGTSGGHDVAVQKVENDRVYFRNPWGARDKPNGTMLFKTPNCILEDNTTGLESMSWQDFMKFCGRRLYLPA